MPVTMLSGSGTVTCAPGRLVVDWQVSGTPADVELAVLSAGGVPAPAVQPAGPSSVAIAALPAPVGVVASPRPGGVFADGVRIDVQVALFVGGHEASQYILPSVDVSGTARATLLRLLPRAGAWELMVGEPDGAARPAAGRAGAGPSPAGGPSEPAELTGLARSALYAARRRSGAARAAAGARRELHVVLDGTASMRAHVRSGAVQSLLEILLGVSAVLGERPQLPVWQPGAVPRRLPPLSPATLPGYAERTLAGQPLASGTVFAPLVAALAADAARDEPARDEPARDEPARDDPAVTEPAAEHPAGRTVVVLTDGVPPDLSRWAQAVAAAPAGRAAHWHLLALARSDSDPQVRAQPWRDELARLRGLAASPLITYSSVTPLDWSAGWLHERMSSPEELDVLVAGLTPWLAPAPRSRP